ncbi:MAG: helix-turn-helix domain-containing protein [Actinomycetota bacterium]
MTHPPAQVQQAVQLRARGLTARAIGDRLKIPRGTVSDWINGRIPRARVPGDRTCDSCGGSRHRSEELPETYVYLLGVYLGDGCISTHPRGVYRLPLTLDAAYPRIVDEAARAIRTVMPSSRVGKILRPGCVEVSSYSKGWPCLFPQHGPGKKHLRPIRLTAWQKRLVGRHPHLLLRGLLHSDGYRFLNTGRAWSHPRYAFSNLSPDIRLIFIQACELVGLRWTISGRTVYVSRKADVAILDGFVGPKA